MSDRLPTIHASAVKVGDIAVLIRGPSGAGKSRLAFDLILAGRASQIPPALLVGDDRLQVSREGDHLVARPAPELAGLLEVRGLGIRRLDFAAEAPVGLVVDLRAGDAERLPPADRLRTSIMGVELPRIPVAPDYVPLPLVIAALTTTQSSCSVNLYGHCSKEIGNHIHPTIATE